MGTFSLQAKSITRFISLKVNLKFNLNKNLRLKSGLNLSSIYILLFSIILSGCAKFDFFLGSTSTIAAFQIQTPTAGTALIPSTTFTITGVCDPLGGLVTITGTSMSEASVNGPCDPVLATFSVNATAMASGELLDLQATQLDAQSTLLNSVINSIMIHCAGAPMRACAISGSGNPSDQYIVGNISCLQEMRTGLSCHYALNNNIDASATSTWNPSGPDFLGWEPIPNNNNLAIRFTGSLDGRGRTISNLYMTPRFTNGVGIFSRLEGTGVVPEHVYDLTLSNPSLALFSLDSPFGFIAGISTTANIRNVDIAAANANLTSTYNREYIGLLIGRATSNTISDSQIGGLITFQGSLDEVNTKYGYVGGLVGQLLSSTVTNSNVNVSMIAAPGNLHYFSQIGGAFGAIEGSNVSRIRTAVSMNLQHDGIAAFSSDSFSILGGFSGSTSTSNVSQVCVDETISLVSTNLSTESLGGYSGRVTLFVGPETIDQVSVRGSFDLDVPGTVIFGGYLAVDFGPTVHSNVFMDLDISIPNGTNANPLSGYGGVLYNNGGGSTVEFRNFVTVSSHNLNPGINNPGGFFTNSSSAIQNSLFYANDPSLGGYVSDHGFPILVTSNSLANLGIQPNAGYTGFDFATVWQRDGVTNIPELRFCP